MTNLLRAPTLWVTERPFVRKVITDHRLGWRLAGRFVAGTGLDAGIRAAFSLHEQGIAAMLDHLGENVRSPAQAADATDAYIRALKRIEEIPQVDCNISVKLTQLGLDASAELCAENMERVLQAASRPERSTLVMIDMEAREYVDRTLEVYSALRRRYPNVGVCLQAYLFRTAADAQTIAGPEAIVRMVKGAYLEPPEVAYQRRREVSRNYGRLSAMLLASGATVHFATHDERLLRGAERYLRASRIPRERYEFQMLYGVRRDAQTALTAEGYRLRVYVPYGTQWYPYFMRRLAERPANLYFFLSNLVKR